MPTWSQRWVFKVLSGQCRSGLNLVESWAGCTWCPRRRPDAEVLPWVPSSVLSFGHYPAVMSPDGGVLSSPASSTALSEFLKHSMPARSRAQPQHFWDAKHFTSSLTQKVPSTSSLTSSSPRSSNTRFSEEELPGLSERSVLT